MNAIGDEGPRWRWPRLARLCALCGLVLATTTCGQGLGPTAVFLDIDVAEGTPLPDHVLLTWLDPEGAVWRERRVPETGSLDPAVFPLATVVIEIPSGEAGRERRALARATVGGQNLVAVKRVTPVAGEWVLAGLSLSTAPLPDADGDGVPDPIDDCSGKDDLGGCLQAAPGGPPGADGGVADAVDGASVDTPGDDGGLEEEDGAVDGAADDGVPAPDATPPDGPVVLAAPTEVVVQVVSPTVVALSWKDNSMNEGEYRIDRAAGHQAFRTIAVLPADTASYRDIAAPPASVLSYRVKVVARAESAMASAMALTPPAGTESPVYGRAFGTMGAGTNQQASLAFDAEATTFFDAPDANNCHVGLDLGQAVSVTGLRFFPRAGQAARMNGGKFQGSAVSATTGFTDLHTITAAPTANAWTMRALASAPILRYVRYLGPPGSHCNVAEIEVLGKAP